MSFIEILHDMENCFNFGMKDFFSLIKTIFSVRLFKMSLLFLFYLQSRGKIAFKDYVLGHDSKYFGQKKVFLLKYFNARIEKIPNRLNIFRNIFFGNI